MEFLIKFGVFLILVSIGYWRGRHNEREHLKLLAAEEEKLGSVLIFATRYPARVAEPMDPLLVTGSAVVGSDHFRLLLAALRKIVGGNYRAYENLLDRARRQAVVRMKQAARDGGASMVFNVRYATSRISNSRAGEATQVEVVAYGTAFVPAGASIAESRASYVSGAPLPPTELFDMMKHRVIRPWLIGWFALVAYCFVELTGDVFFQHQWRFAEGAPWEIFGVLAVVLCGVLLGKAWRAGEGRGEGRGEAVILSLLSVPTLVFVFYFGALRLNALTAPVPSPVRYVLQADLRLQPEGLDLPALYFEDHEQYWRAQKPGKTVELLLTRGWLGFYQYDEKVFGDEYYAFYRSRP